MKVKILMIKVITISTRELLATPARLGCFLKIERELNLQELLIRREQASNFCIGIEHHRNLKFKMSKEN